MPEQPKPVGLATDLYQLTMGASYAALARNAPATFSLFSRSLPANRSYLVAAGLANALEDLHRLRFDRDDLEYLHTVGQIRSDFVDALAGLHFTGDVWAIPEGRVVFAGEPLLEVQAPLIEAQLAETVLVNALHFPTLVATKAARCVSAAPGKSLIDFALRRTPSIDAGLAVARSSYLAGFTSTSNVLAGRRYGIPVAGTVAHSFIETFPSELEAFRAFASTFPGSVTLLIDTYDTIQGAIHAAMIARELAPSGKTVIAVRIDSGDLHALSLQVRQILNEAGLQQVQIIGSGGLDEYDLVELTRSGAPFDAFGIGTRLGTTADAPFLDMAYKLVEYDGKPCLKLSAGKQTLVGAKQVWRQTNGRGILEQDVIAARDEPALGPNWEPLLQPVMLAGEVLAQPSLDTIRETHRREIGTLPAHLLDIQGQADYPVHVGSVLRRRQADAVEAIRKREAL